MLSISRVSRLVYIRGGVRAAFQQFLSASDISGRRNFRATPLQLTVTTQRVDWLRRTSGGEKFPPRASLFLDSVTDLVFTVLQTVVVSTSRTRLLLERSVSSREFILNSTGRTYSCVSTLLRKLKRKLRMFLDVKGAWFK